MGPADSLATRRNWKELAILVLVCIVYWIALFFLWLPVSWKLHDLGTSLGLHIFVIHGGYYLVLAVLQFLDARFLARRYPSTLSSKQILAIWAAATLLPASLPILSEYYVKGSHQAPAYLCLVHLLLKGLLERMSRKRPASPDLDTPRHGGSWHTVLEVTMVVVVLLSVFEQWAYSMSTAGSSPHMPQIQYFAYSVFLLAAAFWGIGVLSGRVLVSFLPVAVIVAFLYSIAILKHSHLRYLPRYSDLFLIQDALVVAPGYLRVSAFLHWLCLPMFAVLLVSVAGRHIPRTTCLAGLIVSIAGATWAPGVDSMNFRWSDQTSMEQQGIISHVVDTVGQYRTFIRACHEAGDIEGNEILSRYSARKDERANPPHSSDENRPTIVLYMIESFLDPRELKVRHPERFAPTFLRLAEEGRSFPVMVPVYGGASVQTEFECLSGLSVNSLPPGLIAYDWASEDLCSVPTVLRSSGYRSTAFVDDDPAMFRRSTAWKHLGWDETVFLNESDIRDRTGRFVADRVVASTIASRLSTVTESPQFLFGFPGGLHGPWESGATGGSDVVELVAGDVRNPELAEYLHRMRDSDEALGRIVQAIEASPRPVVLIVMGDHRPALESAYVALESLGHGDFQSKLARHTVVSCVWANPSGRDFLHPGEFPPASVYMRLYIEHIAGAGLSDPLQGLLATSRAACSRMAGVQNPFWTSAATSGLEGMQIFDDHLALGRHYFSGKAVCLKPTP